MKKKFYQKPSILFFGGAIILVVALIAIQNLPSADDGQYDTFAQCITDSGTKMYGAYWCPHCKDQKEAFGSSFDYITYIECAIGRSGQTQECIDDGIESYPTWEFGDGTRALGTQSMQQLATKTGCELVIDQQ